MGDFLTKFVRTFFIVMSALILTFTAGPNYSYLDGGELSTNLTQTQVINGKITKDPLLKDFIKNSNYRFIIPGLQQGFVPQGLFYSEDADLYLISGYYRDKALPSRIIVVSSDGEFIKSVGGISKKGNMAYGHFGGISAYMDNVYVATTSVTHVFSLSDILSAENDGYVEIKQELYTDVTCSYTNVCDGVLYIGEFVENSTESKNAAKRKAKSPCGEKFYARCNAYVLSETDAYGIKSDNIDKKGNITPDYSFATPLKVQGMTKLKNGNFVFSASATNITDSNIYVFKDLTADPSDLKDNVNGKEIPIYLCTKQDRIGVFSAPPLAEEVTTMPDGTICMITESAAMYYRNNNINPIDHVINWDINNMSTCVISK